MATESNGEAEATLEAISAPLGEMELTFDGGGCRIQVRGPRLAGEDFDWSMAYRDGIEAWSRMHSVVHTARLAELTVEHKTPRAGAGTGFQAERSEAAGEFESQEAHPYA